MARSRSTRPRQARGVASVASVGDVRGWLQVPADAGLPDWAARRLAAPVADELEARRGTDLRGARFGIVDLETTGVSSAARILEIGLVVQCGGRVLERFETLVDPGAPLPSGIAALTGINDAALEGAPDEAAALAALRERLSRHRPDALVAHNAGFDRAFLERAWDAHGMEPALPAFLCSVRLARRCVRAPRFDLDTLVDQLAIARRPRHRALGDAEMTADLWWELVCRARLRGWHTLEALARPAGVRRSRVPGIRLVENRSIRQT